MESYEALKRAIGKIGVKSIAADLGLFPSPVYIRRGVKKHR
ncbi:MAG: hypothetical protein NTX71_10715 [Candidatus Aureabacteria bacterium]|nr:hypothetical protein [Candidatus Auribacterota bacterium]